MAPLVPQCGVCAFHATPANPLSTCSRCGVVMYCSRDHQLQDFPTHKRVCKRAQQCRELIAREEAALRSAEPDMFMPENIFEEGVGHFWGIHETRPYMRAKFEFIRTMSVMPAHGAVNAALTEAMDCLRLCRSDNMGIRDAIPCLMLLLGQLQQCYDFIKWWATCDPDGTYDWGDTELPYLSVKDADMTESTDDFESEHAVFHLAALTFIKMTVAKQVAEAVNARVVAESASLPAPVGDALGGFLLDSGERSLTDLQALQKKLEQQAQKTFKLVHKHNVHYWKYVLDPMPLAREPDPGAYSMGDRFEIKLWVVPNALLWRDSVDFIKENATKL